MTRLLNTRVASCSCRKLRVTAKGDPIRVSICHCMECQLRTGSVFGAQARFPSASIQVDGEYNTHVRVADDGERINFHFCPSCGSTVFYVMETAPEVTAVTVGAFADPQFPSPAFSVYEARKHPWVVVPKEIEHWD